MAAQMRVEYVSRATKPVTTPFPLQLETVSAILVHFYTSLQPKGTRPLLPFAFFIILLLALRGNLSLLDFWLFLEYVHNSPVGFKGKPVLHGCGLKLGTPNGSLVNGNKDISTCGPIPGLILTRTQVARMSTPNKPGSRCLLVLRKRD